MHFNSPFWIIIDVKFLLCPIRVISLTFFLLYLALRWSFLFSSFPQTAFTLFIELFIYLFGDCMLSRMMFSLAFGVFVSHMPSVERVVELCSYL